MRVPVRISHSEAVNVQTREPISVESHPRALGLWIVSDNLRKGAATNAVQIAEVLVERGQVRPAVAPAARVG